MSEPFKLLGLKRSTATELDVRRAYAALLKTTRPDDDPAGFMALRQAFETARAQARWNDEDRARGAEIVVDEAGDAQEDTAECDSGEESEAEDPWYQDTELNRWYANGPHEASVRRAVTFLKAGDPSGGAQLFRDLAADPALEDVSAFDTFSNEVRYSIGALLDELADGETPPWLSQDLAVVLNEIFPWVGSRERDPDTAMMNNQIKAALEPHLIAAGVISAPLEKDDVTELRAVQMEETHSDDHGSYYDRKAETWVDMSPPAAAMRRIVALTTSPWGSASAQPWLEVIEDDALQSVDEFADFAAQLRAYICDETGMHQNDDGAPAIPSWLTLPLFAALDDRFGWTRQQGRDFWERQQNQWLYRVGNALETGGGAARRSRGQGDILFPDIETLDNGAETIRYDKPWRRGFRFVLRAVWIALVISFIARVLLR